MHTVVAGDNLWDLARTYLGSGERWHQIYDLNRGRPQPSGGTLTDPARINPGWDLLIPAAPHLQHGRGNPPSAGRPDRYPRTPAPAPLSLVSPPRHGSTRHGPASLRIGPSAGRRRRYGRTAAAGDDGRERAGRVVLAAHTPGFPTSDCATSRLANRFVSAL